MKMCDLRSQGLGRIMEQRFSQLFQTQGIFWELCFLTTTCFMTKFGPLKQEDMSSASLQMAFRPLLFGMLSLEKALFNPKNAFETLVSNALSAPLGSPDLNVDDKKW
jgi:hypothetical protein